MVRRLVEHATLDAITDRTRNALAILAGGFRATNEEGQAGQPKVFYAGLVGAVVRITYLYLAGAFGEPLGDASAAASGGPLRDKSAAAGGGPPKTWVDVLDALRRLDEDMSSGDRLLGRFAFLSEAQVPDEVVRRVVDELFHMEREEHDLEHLGTVYESMMGYAIAVTKEPSLGVSCRRKAGDSQVGVVIGLESLLAQSGPIRRGTLRRRGIEFDEKLAAAVEQSTSIEDLRQALRKRTSPLTPDMLPAGALALTLTPDRRRSGSHYTPRHLADQIVEDTLRPLIDALGERPSSDAILRLKVCDPAMGSGAFLLAACRYLAEKLARAWHDEGVPDAGLEEGSLAFAARRRVAETCIYGVDKDAAAVLVTKLSLRLLMGPAVVWSGSLDAKLRRGDSLAGFDWHRSFPEVFAASRGGFDAFVGNPPWISYAGRAAQPLDPKMHRYFSATYQSFAGYRNLQGLFIERSATLLRPAGRLGFIIPSSMSEQEGYAPTRAAHDRLCICDENLRDLGNNAFSGVFQPCMALISTRRDERQLEAQGTNGEGASTSLPPSTVPLTPGIWPIERTDLDTTGHALLLKMGTHPALPPHLFGERGIQTSAGDVERMRPKPDARRTLALRAGSDIEPFLRRPPSLFCDPEKLSCRVRAGQEWSAVRVLIRQTARVPMATLSDGLAFRNSILAGFADEIYPAEFLVAYLNATPIRWLHYVRHRDARQGMPQMKIGHLRATPAPPDPWLIAELAAYGELYGEHNGGLEDEVQREIDGLVARVFHLTDDEQNLVTAWWKELA